MLCAVGRSHEITTGLDPAEACLEMMLAWRTKDEYDTVACVDEGRKRVLLVASAILVPRHLKTPNKLFGYKASPATELLIANAIRIATRILDKIDNVNG